MRELLRSKARAAMERAGIDHLNKRPLGIDPMTGHINRYKSKFASNWRKFV